MRNFGAWQVYDYDEVDSTNNVALTLSEKLGSGCSFAVWAKSQTKGRGRFDRRWQSCAGNLFFSQCLEVPLNLLGQIIFVSSLSLAETVKSYNSDMLVQIKWPNDILLNGKKLSGTLIEKGSGDYLVIGIGVNIAAAPDGTSLLYPAISLKDAGIDTSREEFLRRYLDKFYQHYMKLKNEGFAEIRNLWLEYARGLGSEIMVNGHKGSKKGIFYDVDENGLLLLKVCDNIEKIYAGDIFYL